MRQPLQSQRKLFLPLCALASLGLVSGAAWLVYAHRELRWSDDWVFSGQLGLTLLMLACGAGGFGWLAVGLARGPSLRGARHVGSEEWGTCFTAALAASLFDAMALQSIAIHRAGDYEVFAISVAVVSLFAALGLFFSTGFLFTLWRLASRGRSRVLLPDLPALAGSAFECTLEIPFAIASAPAVRATLSLRLLRNESPLNDMNADESTLWSQSVDAPTWCPCGSRRCCATLRFELPAGTPCDFGQQGTAHFWQLDVRSTATAHAFASSYLLPIAFEDPVAEGLLAAG